MKAIIQKLLKRRKKLLINPQFQLTFLLYMMVIAGVMILIVFGTNVTFLVSCYDAGIQSGLAETHPYFTLIDGQREKLKVIFLIGSLAVFVVMLFFGLLLSHRVAGPIYRLLKYFESLREGKTDIELEFRKNDFFPDLADSITEYTQGKKKNKP